MTSKLQSSVPYGSRNAGSKPLYPLFSWLAMWHDFWIDPMSQLLATLGVTMSTNAKRRLYPTETGEDLAPSRGEYRHGTPRPGTQLELRFATEVSGASWADQRAQSEVIDNLVERLRRKGL